MPFTAFHLGPAVPIKSLQPKKISLLVFGWAQVLTDLQPLVYILTHRGHLHGVSHSFLAALLIGLAAALSGRMVINGLSRLWAKKKAHTAQTVSLGMALRSGWLGTFSHVLLDAIIYRDMQPFWPFIAGNPLATGRLTDRSMMVFCALSGLLGILIWLVSLIYRRSRRDGQDQQPL